jgi:pimeloyl-ACP methyl ester carboxylesterase
MAKLAYADAGVGGRPFLLVHGFTGAKEDFTEWLDRLAGAGWHAVAADNRGHGASEKPDDEGEYTFDLLAGDVLDLADDLWGSDASFLLLGHSMGGVVAQTLALRAPQRLTGLVLMDTFHGRLEGLLTRDELELAQLVVREQGIDGLAAALKERGGKLDTPAHERVLRERPNYQEFNDRKFADTAPAAYAALLEAMFSAPERLDALRTLSMPTLVIVGDQDRPLVRPSKDMADAIPGAELAVIADAGHSPQFENPDAWWSALSTFLDRVGAPV